MVYLRLHLRHFLSTLIAACGLLAAMPAAAGVWDFGLYASLSTSREYQVWLPSNY